MFQKYSCTEVIIFGIFTGKFHILHTYIHISSGLYRRRRGALNRGSKLKKRAKKFLRSRGVIFAQFGA